MAMMKKLWGKKSGGAQAPKQQQQQQNRNGRIRTSATSTTSATTTPGASNRAVYRVIVPENTRPGEEFQVYAGSRIVRVRCPVDCRPGQSLQITVPTTTNSNNNNETSQEMAPQRPRRSSTNTTTTTTTNSTTTNTMGDTATTTMSSSSASEQHNNLQQRQSQHSQNSHTSEGVRRIAGSDPPAYMVPVPADVYEGDPFTVLIRGQQLSVTCPEGVRPGMSVRIVPPIPEDNHEPSRYSTDSNNTTTTTINGSDHSSTNTPDHNATNSRRSSSGSTNNNNNSDEQRQLFEVEVPPGVQPGEPFALLAGGVRVLVTCPENAGPGLKIRFLLPLSLTQQQTTSNNSNSNKKEENLQQIRLNYEKDGWTRFLRNTDLKFKWIRLDGKGGVDASFARKEHRFHMDKSAYVRRLRFLQGDDPRLRQGLLDLVPAKDSQVDSKIKSSDGRDLVTYADLARAQTQSFEQKTEWFQETCAKLCVEWNEGHMRMNIRRQFLLGDSVDALMSLSRKDLRKLWRFEFIGEPGIDAGGLAREWFELVCQEIFDPDTGLWMSSATNQMSMTINPASEFCCDDHLIYYRFLGRVMGKAMFDRQLIKGHMVKHLYKHILGWPIYFKDLESVDEEYYNNLKQLRSMHEKGEDISLLALDFTMTSEIMGIREEVELVPDGANIEVTNDNFPEYVEACLKYKLMGSVQPQLNELLLGFFDVIPEALLTIFDYQELELVMCGLPHIDLDDWKAHTEYSGDYEDLGIHHPCVEWFWEILEEDFNDEMRARLLLFVTGTSGVPSRGFGVLQSNDGNIRNFTIHGVSAEICFYPRAHTCFNRIDLPLYDTKQRLQERLKLAVTMSATGFDIE